MKRVLVFTAGAGWLLYCASFLLPVISTMKVDLLGWQAVWDVNLVGWQAGVMSFGALDSVRRDPFTSIVTFIAGLANLVMLLSPLALVRRLTWVPGWLPIAMFVATLATVVVPLAWLGVAHLEVGYYLWCSGFVLVSLALYFDRQAMKTRSRLWAGAA